MYYWISAEWETTFKLLLAPIKLNDLQIALCVISGAQFVNFLYP
jgi:hypothetical protein